MWPTGWTDRLAEGWTRKAKARAPDKKEVDDDDDDFPLCASRMFKPVVPLRTGGREGGPRRFSQGVREPMRQVRTHGDLRGAKKRYHVEAQMR